MKEINNVKNMFNLKTFNSNDKQRNAEYFSIKEYIKAFGYNFKFTIYIAFSLSFIVGIFTLFSLYLYKIMNILFLILN